MNLKYFIYNLTYLLLFNLAYSFKVLVKQLAINPAKITALNNNINLNNNIIGGGSDTYKKYLEKTQFIIEMGGFLVSKLVQRKSGKAKITLNTNYANTLCNNSNETWQQITDDSNKSFDYDLVVYFTIDHSSFNYDNYFDGLPDTNQEFMHGIPCSLSSEDGFDSNRPQSGVILFNYANIFGKDFLNGKILNFDSYVKLAAKSILNIMGLNIDLSQYWLDSNGDLYQSNPVQKLKTTSDGKDHYAIYSPSILAFAKKYFNPAEDPTYLILGTYQNSDIKHITMNMHIAPEDLLSEVNQFSFFYVISGFTLAAIKDLGWYLVDFSNQTPLTFANFEDYKDLQDQKDFKDYNTKSFLKDVNDQLATLNTKYPQQFSDTESIQTSCYLTYGKKEVIKSRSKEFINTGILLYKYICQSSDGYTALNYEIYSPQSGCFISNYPDQANKKICLEQSCLSSGAMIQVAVNQATTTCNQQNSIITGIYAVKDSSQEYTLTCPSQFKLYCSSEKPCQNNCSQNGVCIHQACQCLQYYIGMNCQMKCLNEEQWFNAVDGTCVDKCPEGYYGNIKRNRECTQCPPPTPKCLDDCQIGSYRDVNDPKKCIKCPIQCKECTSDKICTLCSFGYIPDGKDFCKCETGNFDINSQKCVSCDKNQYFDIKNQQCQPCDITCKTCVDEATKCTSCNYPPKVFDNYKCLDNCPAGKYVDNGVCKECLFPCATCQIKTECITCLDTFTLQTGTKSCVCVNSYLDATTQKCKSCVDGEVFVPDANACKKCEIPLKCKTCKINLKECTSCNSPLMLDDGKCLDKCSDGKYLDPADNTCKSCLSTEYLDKTPKCQPCDSNCLTCVDTAVKCKSCSSPNALDNDKCVNPCPDKKYNNNNVCENCAFPCETCQTTKDTCLKCVDTFTLQSTSCVCIDSVFDVPSQKCIKCNVGYFYDPSIKNCAKCDPSCKTCQEKDTFCTSCEPPKKLSNQKCVDVCPAGTYFNLTKNSCMSCLSNEYLDSSGTCKPCNVECLTCVDNDDKCTSCKAPKVLDNNFCKDKCPDGKYNNNGICQDCAFPCKTCQNTSNQCIDCFKTFTLQGTTCICQNSVFDPSTQECKTCDTGEVFDPNSKQCVKCDPPSQCKTCKDKTNNNICTSCEIPKMLNDDKCVDKCPVGKYLDTSDNTCKTCLSNQFLNTSGKCEPCDAQCLTCQDNASKCTSCLGPKVLDNNTCLDNCPPGKYNDKGVCKLCAFPCKTCEKAQDQCIDCEDTFSKQGTACICLNSELDPTTKKCIACSAVEIYDSVKQKCLKCDKPSNCKTCQDKENLNLCTSCEPPKKLEDKKCVDNCSNGKYHDPVDNSCKSCPDGQYYEIKENKCKQCDANCLNCIDSADKCVTCKPPTVLDNNKCIDKCPDGKFKTNGVCQNCDPKCLTCDSNPLKCLSCSDSLVLQGTVCDCLNSVLDPQTSKCKTCPLFQIYDPLSRTCIKCDLSCKTCENIVSLDICSSCLPPLKLEDKKCVLDCSIRKLYDPIQNVCNDCPTGQYYDSKEVKCKQCSTECQTCIDSSNKCSSCIQPKVINNYKCVDKCPEGQFYKNCTNCPDPNEMVCVQDNPTTPIKDKNDSYSCHQSCISCSGPKYDQCITCNQNRELLPFFGKSIGKCICKEGFSDYLLSPCSQKPEVTLIEAMAISSTVLNVIVTMFSSSPTVLLFLIDAQQTLSYFRYLNINKPLNFDKQIKPLYFSHIHPFFPNIAEEWLPQQKSVNQSKSGTISDKKRNLDQSNSVTSYTIEEREKFKLMSGNNRIGENQKYPYFIINTFVIIVFQLVFWIVSYILGLVLKYKKLKPIGERIINIFRFNALIVLIYITISELSLLTFYQFTVMSWESNLEILSSIFSIISLIYIVGMTFLLYNITIAQRDNNFNQECYYVFFQLFKENHLFQKFYPLIVFVRKIIASLIYAFVYESPQAQGILMIILYLPFWAFILNKNPFKNIYAKIVSIVTEFLMLFCHMYFLALSLSDFKDDILSMTDILLIFIIVTLTVYTCLAALGIIFYAFIKIREYKLRYNKQAKIYPTSKGKQNKNNKIDNLSKSNKDDDQLSVLSLTQQNMSQNPLKTQENIQNTLNNSNYLNQSSSISTIQNSSLAHINTKSNSSQVQNRFQTQQFDIIDEQFNDDDDQHSDSRYQHQNSSNQKQTSSNNEDQIEFSFRSHLQGIKEQENEDGSVQL